MANSAWFVVAVATTASNSEHIGGLPPTGKVGSPPLIIVTYAWTDLQLDPVFMEAFVVGFRVWTEFILNTYIMMRKKWPSYLGT